MYVQVVLAVQLVARLNVLAATVVVRVNVLVVQLVKDVLDAVLTVLDVQEVALVSAPLHVVQDVPVVKDAVKQTVKELVKDVQVVVQDIVLLVQVVKDVDQVAQADV